MLQVPSIRLYGLSDGLGRVLDDFGLIGCLRATDRNFAWLECLWQFSNQINFQKAMVQMGLADPNVVCQLEPPLKRSCGDAAMEVFCC